MFSLKGNLGDHLFSLFLHLYTNSLALKEGHTGAQRVLNFKSHSQASMMKGQVS